MKRTFYLSILLLSTVFGSFAQQKTNVMTFNIRMETVQDGENQWSKRKENLASMLEFYEADICGMQEVLVGQIRDLTKLLPTYTYIGVGRDDAKEGGEFSPIFYKKEKYTVLESNTFWLSQTPEKPSKSWDAALNRIVTYAKLKDNKTKKVFYVFNTHFDHIGQVARRESAKMLVAKIKAIAPKTPVILTGDFNSTPTEEPTVIINEGLIDAQKVSKQPHFGPASTFNGFESKEIAGKLIDYIFLNTDNIKVLKHATLSNTWGGRFASDHHAVLAQLEF
ncbi:endonuclease/exonuclease/phosphatase family metal-dependent hydrolase [Arcicella aurantiaca]|uniref:Endonuclease/exonuclease/phosphatase family metal-dependent hydrolase n=1 Tax=Arcicella aurantiaca TaxID=591202 RepID=A0A316EF02_9BACT|nr:endonuclease/exonuclease/phosphatase family protein [Arcicella aurantiaca]PWK29263.1 endonuclease/exonuclease/phosphatase family metal-dependent hydrolase [Arcicella aurantiaca]